MDEIGGDRSLSRVTFLHSEGNNGAVTRTLRLRKKSPLLYRSFKPDTYLSYELIIETLPA